jgi:2,3-bisphosphoglycerate-independent phosphoglycerate mutase
MTRFDDSLTGPVAFDTANLADTLADVLEREGLVQLHAAETEKYAHVTYFFNGGAEAEHRGEERVLVPSPRDVKTYDQAPEMSAAGVAQRVVEGLAGGEVAFAVVNFANPDMVGHSGNIPATVRAVEAADAGLGRVLEAVEAAGGVALVTADHGNAERMLEDDGSPHTAHTTNPVPLVVTLDRAQLRPDGRLGDIAPTVLELLGLAAPAAMGGRSVLAQA